MKTGKRKPEALDLVCIPLGINWGSIVVVAGAMAIVESTDGKECSIRLIKSGCKGGISVLVESLRVILRIDDKVSLSAETWTLGSDMALPSGISGMVKRIHENGVVNLDIAGIRGYIEVPIDNLALSAA